MVYFDYDRVSNCWWMSRSFYDVLDGVLTQMVTVIGIRPFGQPDIQWKVMNLHPDWENRPDIINNIKIYKMLEIYMPPEGDSPNIITLTAQFPRPEYNTDNIPIDYQ